MNNLSTKKMYSIQILLNGYRINVTASSCKLILARFIISFGIPIAKSYALLKLCSNNVSSQDGEICQCNTAMNTAIILLRSCSHSLSTRFIYHGVQLHMSILPLLFSEGLLFFSDNLLISII